MGLDQGREIPSAPAISLVSFTKVMDTMEPWTQI